MSFVPNSTSPLHPLDPLSCTKSQIHIIYFGIHDNYMTIPMAKQPSTMDILHHTGKNNLLFAHGKKQLEIHANEGGRWCRGLVLTLIVWDLVVGCLKSRNLVAILPWRSLGRRQIERRKMNQIGRGETERTWFLDDKKTEKEEGKGMVFWGAGLKGWVGCVCCCSRGGGCWIMVG